MKLIKNFWRSVWLILALSCSVFAFEPYTVGQIRVEGLQRIPIGVIFNTIPFRIGDRMTEARASEVVRALFVTGNFDDVILGRDNDALVIVVDERPSIADVAVEGNDEISSEDLLDGLKDTGLGSGEILNRSILDKVTQELRRQYYANGKYGVQLRTDLEDVGNNRVNVTISIYEGEEASITQINIVGNQAFDDETLIDIFESKTPNLLSFYIKSDRYSKQKLSGDLERLRSYYLDRGYINFRVTSSQVALSPDRERVYITVNVDEGEVHNFKSVKLAGEFVVPEVELSILANALIRPGETYSNRIVTNTEEILTRRLGNDGYAFANVSAVPEIDEETKEVTLTFFVEPGKRVYVRRINFRGNTRTIDEVLRREMRQLEGGWASTSLIERSKTRLERLGFFSGVEVETPQVPGIDDQIDVNYTVEEQPSGQITAGLGFSQSSGILLNFGLSQNNFLGSGKRVTLNLNNSASFTNYVIGYTDPYYTVDGISRGFRLFFRQTDAEEENISNFTTDVLGGEVNYSIPVSENNRFSFSYGYERTTLKTGDDPSQQVIEFFEQNGEEIVAGTDPELDFDTFSVRAGYSVNTLNRGLFPTRGSSQSVNLELTVPGGDLEFYKLNYNAQHYRPVFNDSRLFKDWVWQFRGRVSYGDAYGTTDRLPFFENFFAGGIRTLRGFDDNRVGPRELLVSTDSNGDEVVSVIDDPIGGNLRLLGGVDLIFPTPFIKDRRSVRTSFFLDLGTLVDTEFETPDRVVDGLEIPDYSDLSEIRASVGFGVTWVTSFGPLNFNLANSLRELETDESQTFQFSFGSAF